MEREFDYEVGNGRLMSQKQIVPENKQIEREFDREKELADVVYIFSSKDKPGIRFYDRTPSGVEAQMTGTMPDGKFITDIYSISKAEWDEDLNQENTAIKVKTRNGEFVVKTIMVSEKQLIRIISQIDMRTEDRRVIIDTVDRNKFNRWEQNNLNFDIINNVDPDKKRFIK